MIFKDELTSKTIETEETVKKYLPKEEGFQKTVIEAMNYSFLAGGKRLRPLIMNMTYKMFGGDSSLIEPMMAALEMIHNYSLVHDDLPEMDNDELRRGMPTTHIKYGAGMAVLAGDGLLNYGFETATKAFDLCQDLDGYKRVARALKVLGSKAGIYGMIGGQCLDIQAENKKVELGLEEVRFIDLNKTAALLQCSFMIGAILAGASDSDIDLMEKLGEYVGIAFQLQDDILDITSTTDTLGKPVGSDDKNGKVTYITFKGIEAATQEQKKLSKDAVDILEGYKGKEPINEEARIFLVNLVESLVNRKM